MQNETPGLTAKKPKSILKQPIRVDSKAFGLALIKGVGHALVGKFDDLSDDGADAIAALGIEGKTPEALLYILLQQATQSALTSLLVDCRDLLPDEIKADRLNPNLEYAIEGIEIDSDFFEHPNKLPFLNNVASVVKLWLTEGGTAVHIAETIVQRLPGFFPYSLHKEWQRHSAHYEAIRQEIETPFTQASEREFAWRTYAFQLQQRLAEGIFGESFSLRQIYIPLNAAYEEHVPKKTAADELHRGKKQLVVVKLQEELEVWLSKNDKSDAVRAISGGPGSGKSSFAKVFAATVAADGRLKVLFVPLHLIDPARDFTDEIGRFVREEGALRHNPLDPETRETNLLIILDGLDELASQGNAASVTARNFVRTVQQTIDRRNLNSLQVRVLFSGRDVVMQESESEFRKARQVLSVLPYFVGKRQEGKELRNEFGTYHDPSKILETDLRVVWWQNYGRLTGLDYDKTPEELDRDDLNDITSQPLLNYLLALSFCRGKLDFAEGVNLNQIYCDLVEAVYERGYEQGRKHTAVCDLNLEDFFLILEEIGLASWHGDGRSTTVREIELHCRSGGFDSQLDAFQEGAKRGITRLLAAFFFRQHGERPQGDPTFVFTHKSFGEYLVARRLARGMEDIVEERTRREAIARGKGWSEVDALERWGKWCGPTALSPNIHKFLISEIALRDEKCIINWQYQFALLFSYTLRHGLPMEKLGLPTFQDALFQSRNADETLLAALNACAQKTHKISQIQHPNPASFGAWFKRTREQTSRGDYSVVTKTLSWLNLSNCFLVGNDFTFCDLSHSNLQEIFGWLTNFQYSVLGGADLRKAILLEANLNHVHLSKANLSGANLSGANLSGANLSGADISEADFSSANLSGADFS